MAIKSYSPDLIVYPVLSRMDDGTVAFVLSKAHVLIVGPGLGRSGHILAAARTILARAQSLGITCVIDGVRVARN